MLKEAWDVDAELVKGSGGIFEVAVDGAIVARKSLAGFPSEDAVREAVGRALGPDGS